MNVILFSSHTFCSHSRLGIITHGTWRKWQRKATSISVPSLLAHISTAQSNEGIWMINVCGMAAWRRGMGPLNSATSASFCFHFDPTCVYIIPAVYILWVSCYSGRVSWVKASSSGKSLHFYFIHFFTSLCDFLFYLLLIQSEGLSLVSIQTYCLCSLPLHSNCRSHPDYFVFLWLCMAVHSFSLLPVWFVSWHFLLSLHFQLFMFHFGVGYWFCFLHFCLGHYFHFEALPVSVFGSTTLG